MIEDSSDFFDDFAEAGVYSYGGNNTLVDVIVDFDVQKYSEFTSERGIVITIPKSVVTPVRNATITINSVVYTLGEVFSDDDDFIIQMEATK